MSVENHDLLNCKQEVEGRFEVKILKLEGSVLNEITGLKKDVQVIKDDLNELVTRPEFHPVKLITYGLSGGILMSALAAIMARILGWN